MSTVVIEVPTRPSSKRRSGLHQAPAPRRVSSHATSRSRGTIGERSWRIVAASVDAFLIFINNGVLHSICSRIVPISPITDVHDHRASTRSTKSCHFVAQVCSHTPRWCTERWASAGQSSDVRITQEKREIGSTGGRLEPMGLADGRCGVPTVHALGNECRRHQPRSHVTFSHSCGEHAGLDCCCLCQVREGVPRRERTRKPPSIL